MYINIDFKAKQQEKCKRPRCFGRWHCIECLYMAG